MSEKTEKKKYSSKSRNALIGKIILYAILILITIVMIIPFLSSIVIELPLWFVIKILSGVILISL